MVLISNKNGHLGLTLKSQLNKILNYKRFARFIPLNPPFIARLMIKKRISMRRQSIYSVHLLGIFQQFVNNSKLIDSYKNLHKAIHWPLIVGKSLQFKKYLNILNFHQKMGSISKVLQIWIKTMQLLSKKQGQIFRYNLPDRYYLN